MGNNKILKATTLNKVNCFKRVQAFYSTPILKVKMDPSLLIFKDIWQKINNVIFKMCQIQDENILIFYLCYLIELTIENLSGTYCHWAWFDHGGVWWEFLRWLQMRRVHGNQLVYASCNIDEHDTSIKFKGGQDFFPTMITTYHTNNKNWFPQSKIVCI